MPTTQIDDRKDIARIATERGWAVTEVKQHTTPTAALKANKVLFEVHYVNGDAGIVVMYNAIDKMVSAHLQVGDKHQDHAYRMITVRSWLESYGDPEEEVVVGSGRAKLLRHKKIIAEAWRDVDGEWRISVPQNGIDENGDYTYGIVSVKGFPENIQRRIIVAALKAL